MYKVNDYVVYGLKGVCRISDIGRDEYVDSDEQFYILKPVYSSNLTIKIPVTNTTVMMRPIIRKEELPSFIAAMPKKETIWTDNEKERAATFKTALRSGDRDEWVKIIKSVYWEKQARSLTGKKLSKTDEEIMQTAEKYLYQELAIVLNITPDEVGSYILDHIPAAPE